MLSQPVPIQKFTADNFVSSSFYVRLAVSPCGRFLLSGSARDRIWIWDTESADGRPASLNGHSEEAGVVAWGGQDVVSDCRGRTVPTRIADGFPFR
jgi:WD40 repeat protein